MQQCGHRGRRNGRRGQPGVERENCRLHAEAKYGQDINRAQQVLFPRHGSAPENASEGEIHRIAEPVNKNKTDKCKCRTADRIGHVLFTGGHRRLAHAVHDERQRNKCQQLIEHIHGHKITGIGNPERDAESHRIEGEKRIVLLLALHIFKCVQRRERPEYGNQSSEYHAEPVDMQHDSQLACQIQHDKIFARPVKNHPHR